MPLPGPYQDAVRRARQNAGRISIATALAVQAEVDRYIKLLATQMGDLPDGASRARVRATLNAFQDQRNAIRRALTAAVVAGKRSTRIDTLGIWSVALESLLGAPLGARGVPVTLIGAYAGIGGGGNWRTLLNGSFNGFADTVDKLFIEGFVGGVGEDEMARRIRAFVKGSEGFEALFEDGKIDLRKLSKSDRLAARTMVGNARRIAVSEIGNARAEAEITHFFDDPLIQAIKWTLSPDRGSGAVPDECDILASTDYYDLGPGVYPLGAVPAPPHPFDRCERIPVTRSSAKASEPKPAPPRRKRPKFDKGVTSRFSSATSFDRASRLAGRANDVGIELTEAAIG